MTFPVSLNRPDRWGWHTVGTRSQAYRAANDLFGDIVKVTPSSKVAEDMALLMVAQTMAPEDGVIEL